MAAGYQVTRENVLDKLESIFAVEGVCPFCGNKVPIEHISPIPSNTSVRRYHYRCARCGAEWNGNTYDYKTMNIVEDKPAPQKRSFFSQIFGI